MQWSRADEDRGIELAEYAILETKSTGAPCLLDRSLWQAGHRPSGISKFGTGTAALHPGLSHNKWARVLRGPFASARAIGGTLGNRSDGGRHERNEMAVES